MRKHKRTKVALLARHLAWRKARLQELLSFNDDHYDDDEYDDGFVCTHCGGEGYCQVDDPFWDDCDEFGYGPCTYCNGTGERRHQNVF